MRFCKMPYLFSMSILLLSLCFIFQVKAESTWSIQTVGAATNPSTTSIALDSNDKPHIVYSEYTNDDYRSFSINLTYASWNGSAWSIQTLEQKKSSIGASIVLDSADNPHISYIYSAPFSSSVKYTSWTGSNWNNQTVDTSFTSSLELGSNSLALDSNDNPHIVYSEQSDFNTTLKYAIWTGSNWSTETIDSEAPSFAFYSASISLDSLNNYPKVLYGEGTVDGVFSTTSNVKYAEWKGQSWSTQTVFSNVSSFGNVALDSNGYPHFTYLVGYSLKYASWDGSIWNTQNVDSNPLISSHPSGSCFLALDSNNNPHISYWRDPSKLNSGTENGLMYAYWTGSKWNIETVDNSGTSYGIGPIVLDSAGNPRISYPSLYREQGVSFYYLSIKYASRTESATNPPPSVEFLLWVVLPIIIVAVVAPAILIYLRKRAQKKPRF